MLRRVFARLLVFRPSGKGRSAEAGDINDNTTEAFLNMGSEIYGKLKEINDSSTEALKRLKVCSGYHS
ncbi:Hypothetical protein DEACI_0561 [Acididesulfobacillus acetoxydans]|uniref:Uncharacterized protein n=1 Tax=Acididesulfobacillus acetoxydans TaxID=1561005 RepID=A0A8S0XV14_9FIRM|nr:hypothetical protein [Acididesulfobacillus acetoxydans]CAA7599927.1 Hypothetical protein DEACI_0561 [Acididesulfobacillus acetoxydans]CEJ06859.1 Hypothetical protein DEACI_1312 [Acididesulfobacillus acetoxydans]